METEQMGGGGGGSLGMSFSISLSVVWSRCTICKYYRNIVHSIRALKQLQTFVVFSSRQGPSWGYTDVVKYCW